MQDRLNKLHRKISVTQGQISEIIMSCMLVKQKVAAERERGFKTASDSLDMEVANTVVKFQNRLDRYQRRLIRIEEELEEMQSQQ